MDAQGIRWASSWWGLALKSANLTGNKSWVWHPGPAWTDASLFMDSSYSAVVHRTHSRSSLQMEDMVCVYVLYRGAYYGFLSQLSWVAFTQSFLQEKSWLVSHDSSSSEMLISWPQAKWKCITSIYSKNSLHIQEINSFLEPHTQAVKAGP